MVNSITPNTNAKSPNRTNIAITASGVVLGAGSGRLALKVSGFDSYVKNSLIKINNVTEKTLEDNIKELERARYIIARGEEKYIDTFNSIPNSHDLSKFGKEFHLKDILDEQDMSEFKDRLQKSITSIKEEAEKGISVIKQSALRKRLQWAGIGAAIGLVVGALIVGIKLQLNKKQDNKGQD